MQPQTRSQLLIFVSLAITELILVITVKLAIPIREQIFGGMKNNHPTSAKHIVNVAKKTQIAICDNSAARDNITFIN